MEGIANESCRTGHPRRAGRFMAGATAVVSTVALAGLVGGLGASPAGSSTPAHGQLAAETGELYGVTTTPGGDAWAVGYSGMADAPGASNSEPLTLFWNGSVWKPETSPALSGGVLRGVVGSSPTSTWAVGYSGDFSDPKTVILRRDGAAWQQSPSTAGALYGIAESSPSNAWAVGTNDGDTLILHWNGKAWHQMPGTTGSLYSVAVTSPTNAWAVGTTMTGSLTLHWNGQTWAEVPSPDPGANEGLGSALSGVAVSSQGRFWAVGTGDNCGCGPGDGLIDRWDGTAWDQVGRLTFEGVNLNAIASSPAGREWSVGLGGSGDGPTTNVVLERTGTAWTQVPVLQLHSGASGLFGVAAASRSDVWAVGFENSGAADGRGGTPKIMILHWTGSTWRSATGGAWATTPADGAVTTPTASVAPTTTPTTTTVPSVTTTVPSATAPPSASANGAPLLGSGAWGQALGSFSGISGFGEAAPADISMGGVASSPHVLNISWTNWGASQATGIGQAIDGTGQKGPVSSWPVKAATVVAFDLGSCAGGPPAYQEVTWYFPSDGQTFDPSTATNACTGS